ncbi:MAG: LarC family nickel insertion protein, partial [Pseudomonadota bacterium]
FPELAEPCERATNALLGDAVDIAVVPDKSHGFAGTRFRVSQTRRAEHRSWRHISEMIGAGLPERAATHADGIFRLLAEAEAEVHGVDPRDVHFHEVGALDSIADISAAGVLIDALNAQSWSVGPVPLGAGAVSTEHGMIPVPAPATSRLLRGFTVVDDGVPGERVTPTGAAILAYLAPDRIRPPGKLGRSGLGLGSRELPDRVNGLRLLEIETEGAAIETDQVSVLRFDIDDQTAEDLALGLDRLRQVNGVIDITQATAIGKKGRSVAQIRMLVVPSQADEIAEQVFCETTTLGLCLERLERRVLPRQQSEPLPGLHAKRAARPSGLTAKAEIDDIARQAGDASDRARLRQEVERATLEEPEGTND